MTEGISIYDLSTFRTIHRTETGETFGSNLVNNTLTEGFELFSTDGQKSKFGPLKTDFFYIGLNLTGSVDIQLNHIAHKYSANTIFFKSPDKIFSYDQPTKGYYGYYLLFTEKFIEKVVPNFNYLQQQFPFLSGGVSLFELNLDEAAEIKALILKMEFELRRTVSNKEWMIGSYLFQLFITAHRSYTRQDFLITEQNRLHSSISERFIKLVDAHYKNIRGVKEYADMLHVTPNHLNRLIKKQSQKTASSIIHDRLILEMKSLLKYSDKNISEIAFELNFTDVAHFSHYFKQAIQMTPGAGAFKDGTLAITFGTSAAARAVVPKPLLDPNKSTFCYYLAPNHYVVGGGSNSGGIVIEWFVRNFADNNYGTFYEWIDSVEPGAEGILCLPYIQGERAPVWNSSAQGVFYGLTMHHSRRHLAKAVMESILLNIKQIMETLGTLQQKSFKSVKVGGGSAVSPIVLQLLSDVLGINVHITHTSEHSAWGGAVMAMMALGFIKDFEHLSVQPPVIIFAPQIEDNSFYNKQLERFKELYQSTKNITPQPRKG